MKLAKLAIRRKITFFMLYILIIGAGLFGLSQLKLDFYPDIKFPMVIVVTQYQGVGAKDIEKILTEPLEKTLASVENVKKISSTSSQGVSLITLEFDWGSDLDIAEQNVRKNIDFIRDFLPDDASEPLVFVFDPSLMPIVFLNVSSESMGPARLRKFIEDRIEPFFERIEGVASAETMGGLQRSIQVRTDPLKLAQYKLDINDVTNAIRRENSRLPSGSINDGILHFDISTLGEYQSIDDIKNVLITYYNGKPVYVKDIATVEDGYYDVMGNVRSNYNTGIMLTLSKQSDANTVAVCDRVIKSLDKLKELYGENISINVFFNQAEYINKSLGNLSTTAIQAIIITFFVLLFFLLHWRSAIIVSFAIPVSLISTFFIMYLTGVTLNIISLAGLALAIGMLVDNSIVVLENIFRHKSLGEEINIAADVGTTEVGMAITASTLTTLAVFIPILFVPGMAGMLFRDLVLTITFSLSVSLITALTLIPLLSSQMLKEKIVLKDTAITKKINSFFVNLSDFYIKLLEKAITYRKTTILGMVGFFVLSMFLVKFIGKEFTPKQDQSFIAIDINRSVGTDFRQVEKDVLELEKFIKENIPEAQAVYFNYGESGNPFAAIRGGGYNTARLRLKLVNLKKRKRSQFEIEELLRNKLSTMTDISYQVQQQGSFSTEQGDISVKIFGDDLDTLKRLAKKVEEIVKSVKGTRDVQNTFAEPSYELQISLDRPKIYHYGLSVFNVMNTIYRSFQGEVAAKYREGSDEYDIVVRTKPEYRKNRYDLEKIFVKNMYGNFIPLSEIAKIDLNIAPNNILRESQERVGKVYCSIYGRDLGSISNDVKSKLSKIEFPEGYRYEVGGTAEDMAESFMYLGIALLVAALLVYMVMASQFESLIDPFIIFFSIPLSFSGVMWILFLTNTNISVISLIGMVMLAGIVVNNGIVFIDTINQLYHSGKMQLFDAVIEAGRRRLRPILMTALTTVLSMFPLALEIGEGAEAWAPMARTVIGGLLFSLLISLFYLPSLYVTLELKGYRRKQ